MEDEVLSIQDFASKIKQKYPQYQNVDDLELTKKIIEKYPQYKDKVNIEEPPIATTRSPEDFRAPAMPPGGVEAPQQQEAAIQQELHPAWKEIRTGMGQQLGDWADLLSAPFVQGWEGLKSGAKEFAQATPEGYAPPNPTQMLQSAEGLAKATFGAMNFFVPPVAAFTIGTTATEKVVPEKYMSYILAPITSATEPESDLGKAAAGLGDMAVPIAIGIIGAKSTPYLKDISEKMKKGEDLTGQEVNDAGQVISQASGEEISNAARKVVVDALDPEIAPLKDKELKLHSDMNNMAPVLGDEGVQILGPEVEKAQKAFEEKAAQITQRKKIEKALPLAQSEEAKKILIDKLKKLQPETPAGTPEPLKSNQNVKSETGERSTLQGGGEGGPQVGSQEPGGSSRSGGVQEVRQGENAEDGTSRKEGELNAGQIKSTASLGEFPGGQESPGGGRSEGVERGKQGEEIAGPGEKEKVNVFTDIERLSDEADNAKSKRVKARRQNSLNEAKSKMTSSERFIEDNYEEIARELKTKKLLEAPCL